MRKWSLLVALRKLQPKTKDYLRSEDYKSLITDLGYKPYCKEYKDNSVHNKFIDHSIWTIANNNRLDYGLSTVDIDYIDKDIECDVQST